jgi:hypothetical protein
MSKNHPNQTSSSQAAVLSHSAEYTVIKHDLVRVVILNACYLIAILVLYYTNQKYQYLDRILSHWLHF